MVDVNKFIFETFIKLTAKTWPYGTEDILMSEMLGDNMLNNTTKDLYGNYCIKIGDSRTIFASHLDTVCKESSDVKHVVNGDIVRTDGMTTLGADDKAGVTIMLWMIKNEIPGLYYFFIGEEVGCIGSGALAKGSVGLEKKYDRIISFDRRGTNSVITHQSSMRSCSDAFAKALSSELSKSGLSYRPDDTGVYTDSAEFMSIIPECTNISVGYYKEHTFDEHQDIRHLEKLATVCLSVEWESLPTKRNAKISEYKSSYSHFRTNEVCSNYTQTEREFSFGRNKSKRRNNRNNRNWNEDDYYTSDYDYDTKSYFSSGPELVNISNTQNHYTPFFSKICGKLTNEELDIIRDQYLDMNDYNDVLHYNYLVSYVNDRNL